MKFSSSKASPDVPADGYAAAELNRQAIPRTMKVFMCWSFAAIAWLSSTPSFGRDLCWHDHVLRAPDGVPIYFSAPSSLQASVGPKENLSAGRYSIRNAVVVEEGTESNHLTLASGATVYLSQMPEDACTLEVVEEPDRTGILAKASNHMLGAPAATESRFIPAR